MPHLVFHLFTVVPENIHSSPMEGCLVWILSSTPREIPMWLDRILPFEIAFPWKFPNYDPLCEYGYFLEAHNVIIG